MSRRSTSPDRLSRAFWINYPDGSRVFWQGYEPMHRSAAAASLGVEPRRLTPADPVIDHRAKDRR